LATADDLLPTSANGEGEVRWVNVDDVAGLTLHPGLRATWPKLRAMGETHCATA
jgi:hypothetical protein